MSSEFYVCITTIQEPTSSVLELYERLSELGGSLVVAGDQKGPPRYDLPNAIFLSLKSQLESDWPLANALPVGHYARKNIAYLRAIADGCYCIYETDDDNAPLATWQVPAKTCVDVRVLKAPNKPRWVNAYRYFTRDLGIWPRGLPLDALEDELPALSCTPTDPIHAPVQQSLVNGSPDVDAVWRLTRDRSFVFDDAEPVFLESGNWFPFNTQCTWWWPEAYVLMYIPSHCTFRMCDIWRSFIAQRCLWAMDAGLLLLPSQVVQVRNPHDLMQDFEDEIPGYLGNRRLATVLDRLDLESGSEGVKTNLLRCYEALVQEGFFPDREIDLVNLWLNAFK